MKIHIVSRDALTFATDMVVIGVFQGAKKLSGPAVQLDKALDGALSGLIASRGFEGRAGTYLFFPSFGKIAARDIVLIGLGSKEECDLDALRKVGGFVVKIAREHHVRQAAILLSGLGCVKTDARGSAEAFTTGVMLGRYRFHRLKGTQHAKESRGVELEDLAIVEAENRVASLMRDGIARGGILAEATNAARELVDTPSADMTPKHVVEAARRLAKRGSHITCTVLDQAAMEKMGMGAALAVARGSVHPPYGIHLTYRPARSKKTVALVGKAVTFDSGGLSLKPADAMMTMKIDMAGAATVLGVFQALGALKPNVTVHGICVAVENMPSGSAYRPGDVVTAMDGTTIEVLNTDAEGRVTLADALTYAIGFKPDMVVDVATLTGACVVALGEQIAGIMSNHDALTDRLLRAAERTGEPLWRLPLFQPYASLIHSKIADIKNITGDRWGGALTAGLFLQTFVGDTPWAHLDIAGPSYMEKETRPDLPYGATGYGVRLLTSFLEAL